MKLYYSHNSGPRVTVAAAWHFGPAASGLYFEYVVKPTFKGAPASPAEIDGFMNDFKHYDRILNAKPEGRDWLINNRLNYADFRVAFVFPYAGTCGLPLSDFPELVRLNRQLNAIPAGSAPFAGLESQSANSHPSG